MYAEFYHFLVTGENVKSQFSPAESQVTQTSHLIAPGQEDRLEFY